MFQFLNFYFYKMGMRYIRILRDDNVKINAKRGKCMFTFVILLIFVQSFHFFLLFAYFFISRALDIGIVEDNNGKRFVVNVHSILQAIELVCPLVLGLFMLYVIKYFSRQGAIVATESSDTDSDFFASSTTNSNYPIEKPPVPYSHL